MSASQPLTLGLGPCNHLLIRNICLLFLLLSYRCWRCCCCCCPLPSKRWHSTCARWRRYRGWRQGHGAATSAARTRQGLLLLRRRPYDAACLHVVLESVVCCWRCWLEAARKFESRCPGRLAASWQAACVLLQLLQALRCVLACAMQGRQYPSDSDHTVYVNRGHMHGKESLLSARKHKPTCARRLSVDALCPFIDWRWCYSAGCPQAGSGKA